MNLIFTIVGAVACVLFALAILGLIAMMLLDWYGSMYCETKQLEVIFKAMKFYDYYKENMWCVHIEGSDDIIACSSQYAAIEQADRLRACDRFFSKPGANAPQVNFVVKPWPFSPENHARDIQRQAKEARKDLQK